MFTEAELEDAKIVDVDEGTNMDEDEDDGAGVTDDEIIGEGEVTGGAEKTEDIEGVVLV